MIKIIGCNRCSLIGDLICSLPFSYRVKKVYADSMNIAYLDIRCQQLLPLLVNQDCFDGIRVSELSDEISINDKNYFKKFNLVFNPFPELTEPDYFNRRSVIEETFRMNELDGVGRINPKEWSLLTEEEKKPRLNCWFPITQNNNCVAIWASSGYSTDSVNQKRNPSKQYWAGLVDRLIKEGYKVAQLGTKDHELISDEVLDLRHLSLFDAIKFTLESTISIGVDSGSQHIIGAYGHPQIILSTYWRKGHNSNWSALLPVNYKNRAINIFKSNDINNIQYDKIVEGIKLLNE